MQTKKISTFLAFLFVLSMIYGMFVTTAFAADASEPERPVFVDVLDGRQKSANLPTKEFDLSGPECYVANLYDVTITPMYTNYWFHPNNGTFTVNYSFWSKTGRPIRVKIDVYDLDSKKVVGTHTTTDIQSTPVNKKISFTGLNSSHRYAIRFSPQQVSGLSKESFSGNATIC